MFRVSRFVVIVQCDVRRLLGSGFGLALFSVLDG